MTDTYWVMEPKTTERYMRNGKFQEWVKHHGMGDCFLLTRKVGDPPRTFKGAKYIRNEKGVYFFDEGEGMPATEVFTLVAESDPILAWGRTRELNEFEKVLLGFAEPPEEKPKRGKMKIRKVG